MFAAMPTVYARNLSFCTQETTRLAAASGSRLKGTSHEQIDEIAAAVRSAGAKNVDGPGYHPENDPTFYGVFFEDGCGTALEVCHHRITD
jgi:predicted lactoylglutathione lyase